MAKERCWWVEEEEEEMARSSDSFFWRSWRGKLERQGTRPVTDVGSLSIAVYDMGKDGWVRE